MGKKNTLEQIDAFQKNTMTDHLGIKITDYGNNYICGKMPVDHRTKQPYGLLHGGASVAFAETLGSIGAGMQIDYNNQSVVGIEINASHLKSIKKGVKYFVKSNSLDHVQALIVKDEKIISTESSKGTKLMFTKLKRKIGGILINFQKKNKI